MSAGEYAPSALGPLGARLSGLHSCLCSLSPSSPLPFSNPPSCLFFFGFLGRRDACCVPAAGHVQPRHGASRRRRRRLAPRLGCCRRAHTWSAIGARLRRAGSILVWACTPERRMDIFNVCFVLFCFLFLRPVSYLSDGAAV